MSQQSEYVHRRLNEMVKDGHISVTTSERAMSLFLARASAPSVVPGDELGTVSMIWHDHGWHAEIQVAEESVSTWHRRVD